MWRRPTGDGMQVTRHKVVALLVVIMIMRGRTGRDGRQEVSGSLYLHSNNHGTIIGCQCPGGNAMLFSKVCRLVSESFESSLISPGVGSKLVLYSYSPNLSQPQHQNWHQHGETWDSLVAALRETKISIRAGIRGHCGKGDVLDGMTFHPSNLGAQHCGTA